MSNTALAEQTDWLAEAARVSGLASDRFPTLQDTQRVYRLLKAVADGNYQETAIRIAGYAKKTLYDWRDYAKEGELAAIAVIDALEKAESHAEGEMVTCVRNAAKAGPQFWAAGMTYLERRQPDRWGKRQDDSSAPKVIVQIGVQSGDVSVQLSPSPAPALTQSETLQISQQNPSESDKAGYVNQDKSLIPQIIDVPRGSESEGQLRRGKRRGTLPQGVASPGRTGRSRSKGKA